MNIDRGPSLGEVARLFLRLGCTAFGGPAAHVGLMQSEVVQRRRWLSPTEFLDLLGVSMLLPGPTSTELAMYIGHRMHGRKGLVVVGAAFIAPAALAVFALAWMYRRFGTLPATTAVLAGIKPVVVAIVAQSLWSFARAAAGTPVRGAFAVLVFVLALAGANPFALVGGAAAVGLAVRLAATRSSVAWFAIAVPGAASLPLAVPGLFALALSFLKIGAAVFGSGYVLLAFLRAEFVTRTGWISEQQLLDAVAAGQMTPGPVFTTATFIGYLVSGGPGAVVATVAVFAPAVVLVALSGSIVAALRRSAALASALDFVNAASLAIIVWTTLQLTRASVVDLTTAVLFVATLVALFCSRVNSAWLVAAGALGGWLLCR